MEDSRCDIAACEAEENNNQDTKDQDQLEGQFPGLDSEPEGRANDNGGGTNEESGEVEPNAESQASESKAAEGEEDVPEDGDTSGRAEAPEDEEGEKKREKEEEIRGSETTKLAVAAKIEEESIRTDENEQDVIENEGEGAQREEKRESSEQIEEADDVEGEGKKERQEKTEKDDSKDECQEDSKKQTQDSDRQKSKEKRKEESKEKTLVGEKEGKTLKKSGTTSSPSTLVPRPKAGMSHPQNARPSTRRDAMAKFQQGQTPGVRNFKVQRSSMGLSGGASIKQKVLQWCVNKTRNYEGVVIENFSSSWCNGLAFCALIHRFFPSAFDFSSLKASEREKNFTLAFNTAESLADCCPLLEVSDMLLMGNRPDPLCVFTYVQSLCQHLSKIERERKEKEKEKTKEAEETGADQGSIQGERNVGANDVAEQLGSKEQGSIEEEREEEDSSEVEQERETGEKEMVGQGEEEATT